MVFLINWLIAVVYIVLVSLLSSFVLVRSTQNIFELRKVLVLAATLSLISVLSLFLSFPKAPLGEGLISRAIELFIFLSIIVFTVRYFINTKILKSVLVAFVLVLLINPSTPMVLSFILYHPMSSEANERIMSKLPKNLPENFNVESTLSVFDNYEVEYNIKSKEGVESEIGVELNYFKDQESVNKKYEDSIDIYRSLGYQEGDVLNLDDTKVNVFRKEIFGIPVVVYCWTEKNLFIELMGSSNDVKELNSSMKLLAINIINQ